MFLETKPTKSAVVRVSNQTTFSGRNWHVFFRWKTIVWPRFRVVVPSFYVPRVLGETLFLSFGWSRYIVQRRDIFHHWCSAFQGPFSTGAPSLSPNVRYPHFKHAQIQFKVSKLFMEGMDAFWNCEWQGFWADSDHSHLHIIRLDYPAQLCPDFLRDITISCTSLRLWFKIIWPLWPII